MKDPAGRGRGLQPTLSAHPQPCARPPATTTAAAGAREPVRPAQPSQILPTPPLVKEPRPELLIGPRIVTPADRTPIVHDPTVLHSSRYAGRLSNPRVDAPECLPGAGAHRPRMMGTVGHADRSAATRSGQFCWGESWPAHRHRREMAGRVAVGTAARVRDRCRGRMA